MTCIFDNWVTFKGVLPFPLSSVLLFALSEGLSANEYEKESEVNVITYSEFGKGILEDEGRGEGGDGGGEDERGGRRGTEGESEGEEIGEKVVSMEEGREGTARDGEEGGASSFLGNILLLNFPT